MHLQKSEFRLFKQTWAFVYVVLHAKSLKDTSKEISFFSNPQ